MADVFGLDTKLGGAWSLDGAVLTLGEGLNDGLVVTSINVQYTRRSQKFSPLNQNKKFLVTGESDGQAQLGVIIGPSKGVVDFITRFSNTCEAAAQKNIITINPVGDSFEETKCGGVEFTPVTFKLLGCLITQITLSVAQTGGSLTVLSAGLTMQFTSLELNAKAA